MTILQFGWLQLTSLTFDAKQRHLRSHLYKNYHYVSYFSFLFISHYFSGKTQLIILTPSSSLLFFLNTIIFIYISSLSFLLASYLVQSNHILVIAPSLLFFSFSFPLQTRRYIASFQTLFRLLLYTPQFTKVQRKKPRCTLIFQLHPISLIIQVDFRVCAASPRPRTTHGSAG